MNTSESTKVIMPLLESIQRQAHKVAKSGYNEHSNYRYATLENFMEKVYPHFDDMGLVLTDSVTKHELLKLREDRITASVMTVNRLTHVASGEWIEIDCPGEGIDVGDKATYKAITGARKYAYALMFNLVTTDEPEADITSDQPAARTPKAPMPSNPYPQAAPRAASITTRVIPPAQRPLGVMEWWGIRVEDTSWSPADKPQMKIPYKQVSGISEPLNKILPTTIASAHIRGKDDAKDPAKGNWIKGGVASFSVKAFDSFYAALAQRMASDIATSQEAGGVYTEDTGIPTDVPPPGDDDYSGIDPQSGLPF